MTPRRKRVVRDKIVTTRLTAKEFKEVEKRCHPDETVSDCVRRLLVEGNEKS